MIRPISHCRCLSAHDGQGGIFLYYNSNRGSDVSPLLVGIVRAIAKMYFELDISMELVSLQGEEESQWTIWRICVIGDIPLEEIERMNFLLSNETKAPIALVNHVNLTKRPSRIPRGTPRAIDIKQKPFDQRQPFFGEINNVYPTTSQSPPRYLLSKWSLSHLFSKVRVGPSAPSPQAVRPLKSPPAALSDRLIQGDSNPQVHRHGLSGAHLNQVFPFHLVFTNEFQVVQVGSKLTEFLGKDITGTYLSALFLMLAPLQEWDWDGITSSTNAAVPFQIEAIEVPKSFHRRSAMRPLCLTGQMMVSQDNTLATYLCDPHVNSLVDMAEQGVKVNDLSACDCRLNMILASEHLHVETAAVSRLQAMSVELEKEKQRTIDFMKAVVDNAEQALATKRVFVRYVR